MCLILMSFCSLLKISDIRPVLHSVEFIPAEPLEKLPAHSSNTISVVIILPLKTRRVGVRVRVDWRWQLWF